MIDPTTDVSLALRDWHTCVVNGVTLPCVFVAESDDTLDVAGNVPRVRIQPFASVAVEIGDIVSNIRTHKADADGPYRILDIRRDAVDATRLLILEKS